ncbi:MAG: DUF512 domain-containing protein [Lachnospiraceae bacterium]|nr:DUF512 domain-containing protein [Lachnospiraceae bacterium]
MEKKRAYKGHMIKKIEEGSIAQELGLVPGDWLLAINGQQIRDIFDYQYEIQEGYVELLIEKTDGEQWLYEVEKDCEEELGAVFESGLMDEYHSCSNRCCFCFIDQMPPGMRETLYFKDDDSRLSFLQGNYITLTNMDRQELERVARYHFSPINVSVHTIDPELRCRMLHNRFAGDIMDKLHFLAQAGIEMNGQVVLCRGINDGAVLEQTVDGLAGLWPHMRSLSVVPVGLTRYRDGLEPLEPFGKKEAEVLLDAVGVWQERLRKETGVGFIYASDEWYLLAGRPLPSQEMYDGYPQLENGVGMLRLLEEELAEALWEMEGDEREICGAVATGLLAAPFLEKYMERIQERFPRVRIRVYPIENRFFGESITVSGLLTGQDIWEQLKERDLGEKLLLPCNMLRSGEEVFLDDWTVSELERRLKIPVSVVDPSGEDLIQAVLQPPGNGKHKRRQIYEQTDRGHCGEAECGEIHTV